jgi:hypothetical protein
MYFSARAFPMAPRPKRVICLDISEDGERSGEVGFEVYCRAVELLNLSLMVNERQRTDALYISEPYSYTPHQDDFKAPAPKI